MSLGEVLRELNTNPHEGLSVEAAQGRLEKHGYNELNELKGKGQKRGFGWSFRGVLIMILFLAALISILMEMLFGIPIPPYFPK